MKNIQLLAATFALASLPLTTTQRANAQVNAQAQENVSGSAGGSQVNQSANAGASANSGHAQEGAAGGAALNASGRGNNASASGEGNASGSMEMRPVTGELEGKLDSKTAKPGDQVFLKTDKKVQTADGTVIPKGSRLVGHVTEVQSHEKGHPDSHLGLQFDRAELKGGQSMAIHSMIESMQPSASAIADSSMAATDAIDTPMAGGGGAMGGSAVGGGRMGGGGLLGGTAGGASMATGAATGATGRVGSDLGATSGSAVRTTGNLGSEAAGSLGHGVGAAAQGASSLGAHATGVPGVMLAGDATGSASGMFSAANKNVHLDSGTQMVLGVAAAR